MDFEEIDNYRFKVGRDSSKGMNVDVVLYTNHNMLQKVKTDRTVQQAVNASMLPGLAGAIKVMPDSHEGYGFPIGGVAAFDAEDGIISPGMIGFDINCSVRLIRTELAEKDIRPVITRLADALFRNVPSGVGSRLQLDFTQSDLERIAVEGVPYIISKGFGISEDAERIEENGTMMGADFSKVSKEARSRGLNELGTLGAGNHFLEVQRVERIFDSRTAKAYGLHEGQIVIMVHTGSRGFGHQICSDYLRTLVEYQQRNSLKIPDPELSYAHIGSREANDYLGAMGCAVNFAFVNKQIITHFIMKSFSDVLGKSPDSMGMELLYDLSHNIAKLEEHEIEGRRKRVYVHRKGATRAFAAGCKEIPRAYRDAGQPVLIPGSMGTASYVLCGDDEAMKETYGSACHGAGRVMSRHQALREIPAERTFNSMTRKHIEIRVRSRKLVSEEAEWTYKDVEEVIDVVKNVGIAKPVSRNVPIAVIKG
ncbi:MAG: RtcB family protein [Candidatus Marsarchaeota archaeon]|nr:RtcB family protein [Candidatus Marsarchaeota archaeon]MCL5413147.1 RtcB family protein [Candidatus Marsarchaeota archaeon]